MNLYKLVFNPFQENTYVLADETGEALIIDNGCSNDNEHNKLDAFLKEKNLTPVLLLNTHCHIDHIFGIAKAKERYQIEFAAHSADNYLLEKAADSAAFYGVKFENVSLPNRYLDNEETIRFGNSELKILPVPGHTPGHVAFYSEKYNFVLTGDVLFKGSIGRTDLPGGDYDTLIKSIQEKLLSLPEDTKVYPGHGPESSIHFEAVNNPFLDFAR